MSSTNCAIITRLTSVRKHPNADKLNLATCVGSQIVVDLEQSEGAIGIFFMADLELSHDFCLNNNLYNNSALQKLGLSLSDHPGFFDYKRRVRAQSFRGEKSEGIWLPLSSLEWAGNISLLKEGDTFTEFSGHEICQKYISPATRRALGHQNQQKTGRRELKQFPKHDVTKQLRFVINDIPEDAVIYLTEKLHGTQGRYCHVQDEEPLPKWKQLLNTYVFRAGYFQPTFTYKHFNGSKNVILERSDARASWYGTDDFRYNVTKDLQLRKGEVIYFEIVGWVNETSPIMPPHQVDKKSLPDVYKLYGDVINYSYGCPAGEHRMYVYKIMLVNEDGHGVDLSWPQVKQRCKELGLAHVPELMGPLGYAQLESEPQQMLPDAMLHRYVESLVSGPSTLNSAQIREGVVVRVESALGTMYLKEKSFSFKVLEGIVKSDEAFVDPEDTQ